MASGSVIHAMEHGEHHVHAHGHEDDEDDEHEHSASHAIEAHGHDSHGHDSHAAGADAHTGHKFDPQDMMNMGGLSKRIPVTFITFVIGGLSLAGFPLITAGFWSKDEILADAWLGTSKGFGPQAFVFFMLAAAAFLTAFYTARQLSLTFLGEARTEEAKHAGLGGPSNISSITMQLPLIILAFFALFAGFVGVPSDFPVLGEIFSPKYPWFGHFIENTLIVPPPHPIFNWIPLLTSFGVAGGGLFLGWWMYGRKPLKAGEPDPLVNILGPMHNVLKNKYYFDELYTIIFIKPAQAISKATGDFIDKGIIDGILHAIATAFRFTGDLIKTFNLWLIDGFGDSIGQGIGWVGSRLRFVQTGRVQNYLLMVVFFALVLGLIFIASAGTAAN